MLTKTVIGKIITVNKESAYVLVKLMLTFEVHFFMLFERDSALLMLSLVEWREMESIYKG